MQSIIQNGLKCKPSVLEDCFNVNKEKLVVWLKEGSAGSHLYFYVESGNDNVVCSESSAVLNERSNCLYFVKNTMKAINLKNPNDYTLLSGSVSKQNLVPMLESCISNVYQPMLQISNDNWPSSIAVSTKNKFFKKGEQFAELLNTNLRNLNIGMIELPLPRPKSGLHKLTLATNFDDIIENESQMNSISNCVISWIKNIWQYLSFDPSMIVKSVPDINEGPKFEINFWVRRNLAITKCLQLLRGENFQAIVAVVQQSAEEEAARQGTILEENMNEQKQNKSGNLDNISHSSLNDTNNNMANALIASPNKTSKSRKSRNRNSRNSYSNQSNSQNRAPRNPMEMYNISTPIGLYSAWKKVEQLLSEKNFEAKDNEKFLEKLLPFIEPFYTENIVGMCDGLCSLFNNLKMIFTLSRYYNTRERMSNLLTRITFQIVKQCKECLILGKPVRVEDDKENNDQQSERKSEDDEKGVATASVSKTAKKNASLNSLWVQPIQEVIECMQECIHLRNRYKSEYHETCKKLEEMAINNNRASAMASNMNNQSKSSLGKKLQHSSLSNARQWSNIEVTIIFGKFDKFIKRLEKLIDMFSSMEQVQLLQSQHIDGLQTIILHFNKLVAEFKRKAHNLLDDQDTAFERDFVEFTMNNSHLENRIQRFIEHRFNFVSASSMASSLASNASNSDSKSNNNNDSGNNNNNSGNNKSGNSGSGGNKSGKKGSSSRTEDSNIYHPAPQRIEHTNIEQCLKLLNKFRLIFNREALQNDLDQKYMQVFKSYYKQLLYIQDIFLKKCNNPPIARNMTKVAGCIQWSRQLLRRITTPMEQFRLNPKVFHPKESHKIVKKYNKLAKILIRYEMEYFNAWVNVCDIAKKKLQTTLIIEHENTGEYYANFDRHIFELMREAKFLKGMKFDIPPSAKFVLLLQMQFKSHFIKIKNICEMYNHMCRSTSPIVRNILLPHFSYLQNTMSVGLKTLTWNSMNIDKYVRSSHNGISRLWTLIRHINDILENRIRSNFRLIANTSLLYLPKSESFNVDSFVRLQHQSLLQTKNILSE
jgi:hypothetical protein